MLIFTKKRPLYSSLYLRATRCGNSSYRSVGCVFKNTKTISKSNGKEMFFWSTFLLSFFFDVKMLGDRGLTT